MIKQNNNVTLTHKAYNGQIIGAYASEVSKLAAEKCLDAPGPNRIYGQWLKEQITNGTGHMPSDPKLPLESACLSLNLYKYSSLYNADFLSFFESKRYSMN